jgi:hypothetical protein
MKGISFQNGIEFKVVVEGESWAQGDCISATLEATTKNAGATLPPLHLFFAEGTDKKVKLKSADAFKILEKSSTEKSPLAFQFQLPTDARVSDTKGSLYVVYGGSEQLETLGQLRLTITMHQHLRDLVDILVMHFRFAQKGISAGKKGLTEIKLDPPASKDWASLELLTVQFQLTEKTIEANFLFHRKEIDPAKSGLSSVIVKREITRSWDLPQMLHDFNQRVNKEAATDAMEAVMHEYREASWLNS